MDYSIDVDPQTGWGLVSLSGEVRPNEFPALLAQAWEHAGYAAARCAIWDFTGCQTGYYFNDIVGLTDFIAGHKQGRGPRIVALVASSDLEYGMSRVFSAFEEKCGYTTNVFRTRPEAVAWLRSLGPAGG